WIAPYPAQRAHAGAPCGLNFRPARPYQSLVPSTAMDQWAKRAAARILCPGEASADLRHNTKEDAMLSHSPVAGDTTTVRRVPHAFTAAFYPPARDAPTFPTTALSAPPPPSISPDMWAAPEAEQQSLFRLPFDEVKSVNRLYKIVSQAGCDIL